MRSSLPGRHFARHFLERRALIYQLVKRDFQQRYIGSVAGWLWGLIHPLVLLGVYTYIFGVCLRQKPPFASGTQSYSMFLFAGMLPWLLFSETIQRSSSSIVEHANLVTKTMFPSEIVPVAICLSSVVSHVLTIAMFIVIAAVAEGHASAWIGLLPVLTLLTGLLAIGIGWIAAALQVYLRDTAQVVSVVLTLWMWATPIMILEDSIPARLRFLLVANPLAYIVRAYRVMLLSRGGPSVSDLVIATLFAAVTFIAGGLFFRHMKKGFADVL